MKVSFNSLQRKKVPKKETLIGSPLILVCYFCERFFRSVPKETSFAKLQEIFLTIKG